MDYKPTDNSHLSLDVRSANELGIRAPYYAIPDLFPLHRLSLVLAPSGTGLTQLACHLISHMSPNEFLEPSRNLLATNDLQQEPSGQSIENPVEPDHLEDDDDPDEPGGANHSPPPNEHRYWETGTPSPTVLLLSSRDYDDVLRPRLQALNVNLHHVAIVRQITEHFKELGSPPYDTLRAFNCADNNLLNAYLIEHRDIRLVIIDNAESLFCHCNNPSRMLIQRHLSHLQTLARQRDVAIVLLANIPSFADNPFPTRLLQSFRDSARLVYLFAPDLDDPTARLLLPIKNTLTATHTRRLYSLKPAHPNRNHDQIGNRHSEIANLSYPQYLALLRQQNESRRGPIAHKHNYACEVLIETLRRGPLPVGDESTPNTIRYLVKDSGVCWKTIQRAKQTLQITGHKAGHWIWSLPPTIPTQPDPQPEVSNPEIAPTPSQSTIETCPPSPQQSAQLLDPPALPIPSPLPANPVSFFPQPNAQEPTTNDVLCINQQSPINAQSEIDTRKPITPEMAAA